MKIEKGFLVRLAALLLVSNSAVYAQTTYSKFAPANGVLKGATSTYVTTPAVSSDILGLWTGTCSSTTYMRGDGQCATPPGTGGGTVNSVALTAPSVYTVTGSPITNTGTLALTFATGQTANQVLATPNGSTGAVGLRALVAADIPTIPLATGVSGTLSASLGGTGEAGTITGPLKGNGTSAHTAAVAADIYGLWSGTCSSGTFLRGDGACAAAGGTGTVTSVAMTVPSGFVVTGSPITTSGTLAITGQLNPSGGGTGVATITGPIRGNGTGSFTSAAAADIYGLWSGTCSSGTFLRGDGACAAPSGVSGANPTASVGLTVSNGVATTYMRSDAAPPLDQSISPTMSGTWLMEGTVSNATGAAAVSEGVRAGVAATHWINSAGATDAHLWELIALNSTTLSWRVLNDALTVGNDYFDITRSGANITNLTYGNGTNNPSYTFAGTGAGSVAGSWTFSAARGLILSASGGSVLSMINPGAATDNRRFEFQSSGTDLLGYAVNDAVSATSTWLDVARSGTTITDVSLGNATANNSTNLLGTGVVTAHGAVVVGAPTGGSKGTGTINMTGCFVNNQPCLTTTSGGANKFASGVFTFGAGGCTINQNGGGIASCSSSTGSGTIVFTTSYFSTAICVATGTNGVPLLYASTQGTSVTTNVNVLLRTTVGAATDGSFTLMCAGN